VSLGKGQALYQVLQQRLQDDLATVDQDHRSNQVNLLLTVYRTAHEKKYPGVIDDLKTFASKRLPQVLRQQTNHYETIVGSVAGTIHDLASPRDGMAFLLDRIENEPGWFKYNNQDGWSRHGWTVGHWHQEAKNLGELEDRLLKLVVAELRRDLES